MAKYHVVFHLDDGSKARATMVFNNIKNLIVDLGGRETEIEVVINGDGVLGFLKAVDFFQDDIARLKEMGVRFLVCANSLETRGIAKDAVTDAAKIVPAGVSVLVERQQAGWAYVRP